MFRWLIHLHYAVVGLGYVASTNEVQGPSQPDQPEILDSSALNWNYVGCFADSHNVRTLPGVFEKYRPLMNVVTCTAICLSRGSPIAALQTGFEMYFGQQCFCMAELKTTAPADECNIPCEGNPSQMCGGKNVLSVYHYGGLEKPRVNKPIVIATSGAVYRYAGCWQDISPYSVLTGAQSRTTRTIEQCVGFCSSKGFSIAGLKFYGACYCSDLLSGSHPADPQDCNLPCGGDSGQICGGANVLSIYRSGPLEVEPYPTIPPPTKLKYKGHDISSLLMLEEGQKIVYHPPGGTLNQPEAVRSQKTFEQLLRDSGANAIRLRMFTSSDPDNFDGTTNGLAYNIALAKRAVAAGHSVMLCMHYSDHFADPGTQDIPLLWRHLNEIELLAAIREYTTKVLDRFHEEGVPIEFYSTGNEIRLGMLWPLGGNKVEANFENLVKFQNSIIAGVQASKMMREPASKLKILLHLDGGAQKQKMQTFWNGMRDHGFVTSSIHAIALTWYPFYSILETRAAALDSFTWMADTLRLPLIVVETNWPKKCENRENVQWPEDLNVSPPHTAAGPNSIGFSTQGQITWYYMIAHVLSKVPHGLGVGLYNWESGWTNLTNTVCEDSSLLTGCLYRENTLSETGRSPECVMSEAVLAIGRL